MTITFPNRSRHTVVLRVDGGEPMLLPPLVPTPVVQKESGTVRVTVRRDGGSFRKKWNLLGARYHLLLETEYLLSGVPDGERIDVTRERTQFSADAAYDRLFLRPGGAVCLSQTHRAVGEERMKRAFVRDHWVERLLARPFLIMFFNSFPYTIPLLVGGVVAAIFWKWQCVAAIVLALYLLVLGATLLCDTLEARNDKNPGWKAERMNFFRSFDPAFLLLQEYYAKSDREPYRGKAETD